MLFYFRKNVATLLYYTHDRASTKLTEIDLTKNWDFYYVF